MHLTTRRKFLVGAAASATAARLARADISPSGGTLPVELQDILAKAGFDSANDQSALLAIISDPHIFIGPEYPVDLLTEKWDDQLIDEINSLGPDITDLLIVGDLITHHSMATGGIRHERLVTRAKNEFALAKAEMARFRSGMRQWAVPGNHDTDAFEKDAELWQQEIGLPPYQMTVLGGVPVLFLNSGNGGMLNPGQLAWFVRATREIPKDQEVLVVVHHPAFLHLWVEAGVKRILAEAFEGHESTIWIVSGHGHWFSDRLFVNRGVRFVQMEVTTANPKAFSDKKAPGYALLALQDGRVIQRVFRSLKTQEFQPLSTISKMMPTPVSWPFDGMAYPADVFEHGFYDQTKHLVNFNGVDVGCQVVYCKSITLKTSPERYGGKAHTFSIAASISASFLPLPTCSFSATNADADWIDVPFPPAIGHGLYHIPIPAIFQNVGTLYIRLNTALTNYYDGFITCGWALGADRDRLTEYEKWISRRYRTILATPETVPDAITPQSSLSNILNFGFNLPTVFSGPQGPATTLPSSSLPTGLPVFSKGHRQVTGLRFARRTSDSGSGISYHVEQSTNLLEWTRVANDRLAMSPLEPGWEEVVFTLPVHTNTNCFCRVGIVGTEPIDGSFNQWQSQVAVTGGTPDDWNANGTSDLMEFAFDLEPGNGGIRFYDPDRANRKAGIPVQISRVAELPRIVFPRMRSAANPGVTYTVESSIDEITWTPLATWEYSEQVLRSEGDWDEVEVIVLDRSPVQDFYRIRLDLESPLAS